MNFTQPLIVQNAQANGALPADGQDLKGACLSLNPSHFYTTIICKLLRTPQKRIHQSFTHNHGAGKLRIHVTVVDLRDETHFGRFEGIFNGKVHLQEEHSIRVRRVRWTAEHCLPMKQVLTNLRQLMSAASGSKHPKKSRYFLWLAQVCRKTTRQNSFRATTRHVNLLFDPASTLSISYLQLWTTKKN